MAKAMAKAAKRSRKKASTTPRKAAKAVRALSKRTARRSAAPAQAVPSSASSLLEDHLAIHQLLYRYCHAVDRGTLDEVADLFHRDAVLLPRYENDKRYEGREAVCGWYERYFENLRAKVRYLRHKIESPVIEIMGIEATAVCYLDADAITISTNEPVMVFGRYDDKFIKDAGRWWFKERAIITYYSHPLARYREGRGA